MTDCNESQSSYLEWKALTEAQRDFMIKLAIESDAYVAISPNERWELVVKHYTNGSGDGRWQWLTWRGYCIIPPDEVNRRIAQLQPTTNP